MIGVVMCHENTGKLEAVIRESPRDRSGIARIDRNDLLRIARRMDQPDVIIGKGPHLGDFQHCSGPID